MITHVRPVQVLTRQHPSSEKGTQSQTPQQEAIDTPWERENRSACCLFLKRKNMKLGGWKGKDLGGNGKKDFK